MGCCFETKDCENGPVSVPLTVPAKPDSYGKYYTKNTPEGRKRNSPEFESSKPEFSKYNNNSLPEKVSFGSQIEDSDKFELEKQVKILKETNSWIIDDLINDSYSEASELFKKAEEIRALINIYYNENLTKNEFVSISHLVNCNSCDQCRLVISCQGLDCRVCEKLRKLGDSLEKIEGKFNLMVKEKYEVSFKCQNKQEIKKRFIQAIKTVKKKSDRNKQKHNLLQLDLTTSSHVYNNENISVTSIDLADNSVYQKTPSEVSSRIVENSI
jgi:hypothetical protein